MDRTILHCDMNGFYASVELLSRPDLKNKPVAVCGSPENRHGIVLAKNELAKAFGVTTAETVWQAKRKCPGLVLVRPHHDTYQEYSDRINEIYHRYSDQVEPYSIDESWIDVSDSLVLFGSGKEIGDHIRETIKSELGLTLSVGVSYNKIFAKMGSDYKKPDATTVITRGNYKELIWPLPVRDLFFVGKATAEKLEKSGILNIGDLAVSNINVLINLLGKHGSILYNYANGFDESPVSRYGERQKIKSVGNGMTFRRDLAGINDIKTAVTALSDTVAGRLRHYKLKCKGVKVEIKDPLFKTITRQTQLEMPTNLVEDISKAALKTITSSWNLKDPIRLLTITGIGLTDENDAEQLSIFEINNKEREKSEKVQRTLDHIREKYGESAITFGRIINNDIGIELYHQNEEEEYQYEDQAKD